jgi:hypothetical protein
MSNANKGFKRSYKVSKEGRKTRSESGRRNLEEWKKEHPGESNMQHGVTSKTRRKRYTDLRTREGQQLQAIMQGFIEDCGGEAALDQRQRVLLSIIQTKMITILLISDYVDGCIDKTGGLIDANGELLSILGKKQGSFLTYTESLMRDLDNLYRGNQALKNTRIPTIEELVKKGKSVKSEVD